jgi:hypothetical protein
MSGGGGGYSSGPTQSCPCDQLVFSAVLQSPIASIIRLLKVGDELNLELRSTNGPVMAVHKTHGDVGSIVNRIAELIPCLEAGTDYVAKIISIAGVRVLVEVRPV